MENYFKYKSAAERYAKGRPNVQVAAIKSFKDFAKISKPFKKCLDVGCGTGLSSIAVAEICESVVGIDMSEGMLAYATPHPKIKYLKADAENIPFADATFDLISVGLAMHWFDQLKFLKEAARVLVPNGWLVIYYNEFKPELMNDQEFESWYNYSYLIRYPNPPRKNAIQFDETLASSNFDFKGKEDFKNDIEMNQAQFVAYLTSQSNIIAQVEQGSERIEDVELWLTDSTQEFFETNSLRVFKFTGGIWYLRKSDKKQRTVPYT